MKLKINDGNLSYHTIGQGPTIVFVAGGPAVCGTLYEETFKSLSDKNTLAFWDYAGCNLSMVKRSTFSVNNDFTDLENVVEASKKPVVLMGHSYGGLLAIKYASDHPEDVRGLILINSMPSFSHAQQSMKKKMDRLAQLGFVNEYMNCGEKVFSESASAAELKRFWEIEAKLQVHEEHWSSEVAGKLTPSFSTIIKMKSDLLAIDYSSELKNLKIPILITAGSFDLVALNRPKEMHSWLPQSTFHEYHNSGHSPFLEENSLFITQTSEWLKNIAFR